MGTLLYGCVLARIAALLSLLVLRYGEVSKNVQRVREDLLDFFFIPMCSYY